MRDMCMQIVSDDGKKVRRRQPFTEKHKEELQSRMIIAENLPEDSSRNSLEKIFGVVGRSGSHFCLKTRASVDHIYFFGVVCSA
jgi:hypothetical protein